MANHQEVSDKAASPYPRLGASLDIPRPKPKFILVRMGADLWSMFIGLVYGLAISIPSWIVPIVMTIALAWRAFRVERRGTDFAPRAMVLAMIGWFGGALSANYSVFYPPVPAEPLPGQPPTPIEVNWMPTAISFASIFLVWLGSVIYRRLNRRELEPLGAYESFRNGAVWIIPFIVPFLFNPISQQLKSPPQPVAHYALGTVCILTAIRLGTNLWQRVCAFSSSAWLAILAYNSNGGSYPIEKTVDANIVIGSVVVLLVFVGIGIEIGNRRSRAENQDFGGIPADLAVEGESA